MAKGYGSMSLFAFSVESRAIITQSVVSCASASFPRWYITPGWTRAVIVMNPLISWFCCFIYRMEFCDLRHFFRSFSIEDFCNVCTNGIRQFRAFVRFVECPDQMHKRRCYGVHASSYRFHLRNEMQQLWTFGNLRFRLLPQGEL